MKTIPNSMLPAAVALLTATMLVAPAIAQDSHYRPVNQQFPSPECLTESNAYLAALAGGYKSCSAETHEGWLHDLQHWRD